MVKQSVQPNLEHNVDQPVFQNGGCCSHRGSGGSRTGVFGELLRQISPLCEKQGYFVFFVRLKVIYK
jgi:hypothetical protein